MASLINPRHQPSLQNTVSIHRMYALVYTYNVRFGISITLSNFQGSSLLCKIMQTYQWFKAVLKSSIQSTTHILKEVLHKEVILLHTIFYLNFKGQKGRGTPFQSESTQTKATVLEVKQVMHNSCNHTHAYSLYLLETSFLINKNSK